MILLTLLLGCGGQDLEAFRPKPLDDYSWASPGLERVSDETCSVPTTAGDPFVAGGQIQVENRTEADLDVLFVDLDCAATQLEVALGSSAVSFSLIGGNVIQLVELDGTVRSTWQVDPIGLGGGSALLVIQ